MNQHWHEKAANNIEESIKHDMENMTITDLLGLQNLFYYQYKGSNAEHDCIYQLLAEELERRLR